MKYWLKNWKSLTNSLSIILILLILITSFLSLSLFVTTAYAEKRPALEKNYFPDMVFQETLTNKIRTYLGLSTEKNRLTIKDISGSIFIFEIFNTYCTSCPRNVPILNEIYSIIENNPVLKGKIKIIGIAVGNNRKEVEMFVKEHKVLYPVLTDYNFNFHSVLGSPRVPYTILVKRNAKGENIIFCKIQGVLESSKEVMDKINTISR